MSEIKRKGQIVPRWLVKSKERKAQHLITFGADVEIFRGQRKVKMLSGGSAFYIKNKTHVKTKRNKVKVKGFNFGEIKVYGFDLLLKV